MSLKLMAVDDEAAIVELIRTTAEPLGCDVIGYQDSRQAALRLEEEKIHGIFIDINMPEVNGFELTRRVRQSSLNAAIPVVLLTGQEDAAMMRQAFEAGGDFFLAKPFGAERLESLFSTLRGAMIKAKIRYVRLPFRTSVLCLKGAAKLRFSSLNLSEDGMLLESHGRLNVGDEVRLSFAIPPNPMPWETKARVVRKETPGRVGVEFQDMVAEERELLQRYLNEHLDE